MKVSILILICIFFSYALSAQTGFFGRMKKPDLPKQSTQRNAIGKTTVTATDSTFWSLRPIATGATAFIGGTVKLMAGTGMSYQNLTYNYATGKFYCNYAISALVLAGGSIIPTKPTDIMSGGIMLSFLNNTIGGGICGGNVKNEATGEKKFKIGFMTTLSINFNN